MKLKSPPEICPEKGYYWADFLNEWSLRMIFIDPIYGYYVRCPNEDSDYVMTVSWLDRNRMGKLVGIAGPIPEPEN
jgi:hypothetical protein